MNRHNLIKSPIRRAHLFSAHKALILMISALLSAQTSAETDTPALVLPDEMNYYNPLKHGRSSGSQWIRSDGMNNIQLEQSAQDIRSQEMIAQQRALNHQWLAEQDHHDIKFGRKVITRLVKMGFRTYWDGVRETHYKHNAAVPTSSGLGKITPEVDYKVRLSGDKLKLSVRYEF